MSKRTLPLWMARQSKPAVLAEVDLHANGRESKPADETSLSVAPAPADAPKRRLRSNYFFAGPDKQPDLKIEYLPFVEYDGTIEYHTALHDVAFCCELLLAWVNEQAPDSRRIPIAFDLEWPVSFRTGPGRTALLQLCATTDRCLLLQLSCLQRLPASLLVLLHHPRVLLHGVNIKNDFRKLARDFGGVDADRLIAQCVDLGQWYNELHGPCGRWSMARLVQQVLRQRISKDNAVRISKWDVLPLSDDQKLYAAIDVYISQRLYLALAEQQCEQRDAANAACEQPAAASCLVPAAAETLTVPLAPQQQNHNALVPPPPTTPHQC